MLTAGTILFAGAQNVAWLFAARLVQGLATGTLMPAATAALIDLDPSPDGRRGSQQAVLAFLAGASIGSLLAGAMAQYLPHPTVLPFVVVALLDVAGLVWLVRLPPNALNQGTGKPLHLQQLSVPADIREAFSVAAAVVIIAWSLGGIYAALGPSMVRQVLHQTSHFSAGAILFLFNVSAGGCQLLFRRAEARQLMRAGIVMIVIALAGVQVAFAGDSSVMFILATIVAGAGQGLCYVGSATPPCSIGWRRHCGGPRSTPPTTWRRTSPYRFPSSGWACSRRS
jgi:MFS family permease